jgi:hypothetical protein
LRKWCPDQKSRSAAGTRERDRAYYGSVEHFIRSLKNRELKKNQFLLYDEGYREVNESRLLASPGDSVLTFTGKLRIVFAGETSEYSFDPKGGIQESIITLLKKGIRIYSNGMYQSFEDINVFGYMGWSSTIAEMVPLGYQPASGLE